MRNVRKALYVQRQLDSGMVSRRPTDEHSTVKLYIWARVSRLVLHRVAHRAALLEFSCREGAGK